MASNPLGLDGIDFVTFASPDPEALATLFRALGFSRTMRHAERDLDLWQQGDIRFLLDRDPGSFSAAFARAHGPCIPSMGWRVADASHALAEAQRRGAVRAAGDLALRGGEPVPAIEGIGGSLLYLCERKDDPHRWGRLGFVPLDRPELQPDKGFFAIDHLTNNVERGTLERTASFYKDVFGFTEVRYFDIRGVKTGLQSFALRSPCGRFCIPINEAREEKSQIAEYLREYRGPGVQHLALISDDLLSSLAALEGSGIETLDIEDDYYDEAFGRVPGLCEDRDEIRRRKVLVDGDAEGYLLQIFTKNVVGPIFVELIQRRNHASFGEGNFGALFRSIERDQARRGVL